MVVSSLFHLKALGLVSDQSMLVEYLDALVGKSEFDQEWF